MGPRVVTRGHRRKRPCEGSIRRYGAGANFEHSDGYGFVTCRKKFCSDKSVSVRAMRA